MRKKEIEQMENDPFTERIIACAYKVHNVLGPGFLEKVYENALLIELNRQGFKTLQQYPIKIYYDDQIVGDYFADLLVENKVLIELKAIQSLSREHEVQLVNYLTATRIEIGLLLNFSQSVQIKRKYRQYFK